jgi:group I intron endonuclease
MVGIYEIKNKATGKSYIGSSKQIQKRWEQHLLALRKGIHHSVLLQRAWNKYGEDCFEFSVKEECEERQLLEREQQYLNTKPEYNIGAQASGGDNLTNHPNRGAVVQKIRQANQARMSLLTEEERKQRFSRPMENNPNWKGGATYSYCKCGVRKKPQAKTCNKCRDRSGENNPFYGKKHSQETKQILRECASRRTTKPCNSKKVVADGVEYQTAQAAATAHNISRGLVNYRCNSDKYTWQFKDN